ncbi:hypothetical protein Tco_0423129, partial [Tanacetum coccineum]
SLKDATIADIMGLLHLEGPAAETPDANQLQPSPEKLMLPIYRPEDQVVIGETSLSFSLDVVHAVGSRYHFTSYNRSRNRTRNEKERVVLERETRERLERKVKRYFLDILNNFLFQVEKFLIYPDT